MSNAFKYTQTAGINMESHYPYTAQDGTCKKDVEAGGMKLNKGGYRDVPKNSADQLMAAIVQQPVSVGIEADDFQYYKSGVFDDVNCGDQLNHGVLAVGYGSDSASGKLFWKIKNSWGGDWGENGFFRIERKESETGSGLCGILKNGSYPVA